MPSSKDLQAVTGQLYIVEGTVQETDSVPGLLAQSAPAKAVRGRGRDSLFIHLTLTGLPEETAVLSQDLLDIISREYYQSSGSVTAALRRAVIAANQQLLRLNLSGASDVHEGAVTCAVLRGGELFIVQTGEALALLGHNFGVERLPPKPPDRITPLGRSAGIDIRFFHHRLQAGNMLLLADPRIAHLPLRTLSPALVDTEVEWGLTELAQAIGSDSARLLLVEFTDHLPEDLPAVAPITAASERASGEEPAPQPRRERGRLPVIPHRERQPQPERPFPPRRIPSTTNLETGARKAASGTAMGLSRFTGWLADLLTRLRPPRSSDGEPTNWTVPASVAILIPLVMALIVGAVYIRYGRGQRFAEIKVEMGQNLGLAEAAGEDEAQASAHYHAVLTLAAEAETIRPGDQEIARLRQQAQGQLDRLDDVTRLTARPFHTFDETAGLTAVTLQEGFNGDIYTLDGTNSQVFRHQTDESYLTATAEPEALLFSGQAVGNHVVNNIVDIFWRPRGNHVTRDGLAALDSVGALIAFYPDFSQTEATPLGFASEWQLPRAVTPFAERLYILDNGARQVWKYFPDGDGFLQKEDERTLFFNENPGLEAATDIAIYSEDGSLVVIYGDGRIRYYDTRSGRVQWDENHLLENGLNNPLVAPTAVEMVGKGLNASIFVADPGSGRIIEISRGGTTLAQYRAGGEDGRELFANIADFAVVKAPLRVFFTAGNVLYTAVQE
ncbi:MAG: hypothetical protein GY803_15650 [Chloroflexi bacterium]|nr:hypothetical protein [Chloroflexota bacterium]